MMLSASLRGKQVQQAALGLVGAPFRLHGRSAAHGLDCIGLVALTLTAAGCPVPALPPYRLRMREHSRFDAVARACGLRAICDPEAPGRSGDIVVLEPGPAQFHLGIGCECGGLIHAHAGLGRVIHQCPPWPWPVAGGWRLI